MEIENIGTIKNSISPFVLCVDSIGFPLGLHLWMAAVWVLISVAWLEGLAALSVIVLSGLVRSSVVCAVNFTFFSIL